MNSSPQSEFILGIRDTFPLIIGTIPFGIIFGTLAESGGLTMFGALAFSAIVFAGSAQFIALGMLASGVSWPMIVLTTFIINLRHLLYSTTLQRYVRHLPQSWRIPMAFGLTDETFAVAVGHFTKPYPITHKHWYFVGSSLSMYLNWQLCTVIGLFFGNVFPDMEEWGLDFAMSATFIGIVVPYLKNKEMICATLVSSFLGVMFYDLPNKIGLILAALVGVACGYFLEQFSDTNSEKNSKDLK
jgi:4-azaleucine resistance transporter AzlC